MIGFVAIAIAVSLLASWSGYEPAEAVGMGLFVGSWGGCGFGAMLGGTISFVRAEDRARAEGLARATQRAHVAEAAAVHGGDATEGGAVGQGSVPSNQ